MPSGKPLGEGETSWNSKGQDEAVGKWSKSETEKLRDVLTNFAASKGIETTSLFGDQLRQQKGLKGSWIEIHTLCREAGLMRPGPGCGGSLTASDTATAAAATSQQAPARGGAPSRPPVALAGRP